MPMLGDVFIDTVFEDSPNYGVKSTDHPVETKETIVDHIEKEAVTLSISGVIVGDDAEQRKLKLLNYMNSGETLKYSYATVLNNVIIEKFNPTYEVNISNGFTFSITLKQIRMAKVAKVAQLPKAVIKQAAKVGNKGLKQKKTKTNTTPTSKKAKNVKVNPKGKGKEKPKGKATSFNDVLDRVNNR